MVARGLSLLVTLGALATLTGCAMREARPREMTAPGPGPGSRVAAAFGVGPATEAIGGQDHDHDRDDDLPPLPPPDAPEASAAPSLVPAATSGPSGVPTASRYASLDRASCEAELGRRSISFSRVTSETRGVIAPLRLTGPIRGVEFHSMLPSAQRKTSPYEIYDCRLVLALDDFARILQKHDIIEAVHFSVYRPPTAKALPSGAGRRHSGALAIDLGWFKTKDGKILSVDKDFHGRIGGKSCGPAATPLDKLPAPAAELRRLVCESADAQLFNVMLTPHYNWQHKNHFHFEVTAGVKWILVR